MNIFKIAKYSVQNIKFDHEFMNNNRYLNNILSKFDMSQFANVSPILPENVQGAYAQQSVSPSTPQYQPQDTTAHPLPAQTYSLQI